MQKEVHTTLRTPGEVSADRDNKARTTPRYSYDEVTSRAEAKIGELLDKATAGEASYLDYALGVYFGWLELTALEHTQIDVSRLDPLRRWETMRADGQSE